MTKLEARPEDAAVVGPSKSTFALPEELSDRRLLGCARWSRRPRSWPG
jgi:hypothetical protein